MSVNQRRGEILAHLNGKEYRLCLTLGALAELENAYAVDDLSRLVERFSSACLSSKDMIRIIGAGLRGAGEIIDDTEVSRMQTDGAASYAKIVADLLSVTFGAGTQDIKNDSNP